MEVWHSSNTFALNKGTVLAKNAGSAQKCWYEQN